MSSVVKKGIVLAGGLGSRLYPASLAVSKQLLAVYDKPMIYYPLSVLMDIGVTDIMIIVNAGDADKFNALFGNGERLGINIRYAVEDHPKGIANAFIIASDFIDDDTVALILGDNIYCDTGIIIRAVDKFESGALVFGVTVYNPDEYGVAEVSEDGRVLSIEEKPTSPKSNIAVTGLYVYDSDVVAIAEGLKPSARGELEITDVNMEYVRRGNIILANLGDEVPWFDAGTAQSMMRAGHAVADREKQTGRKIGCPEEIALECGYISLDQMRQQLESMPESDYKAYLTRIVAVQAG
ncbi:MAG: sugar phosphate nucleotidyltransferase [Candidatus Zixiibacteriota bacterium]